MIPDPKAYKPEPSYVRELIDRIGRSQQWIADNCGISKRRIQYLLVGTREVDGEVRKVTMSYPEQFTLEALAQAGERFPKRP